MNEIVAYTMRQDSNIINNENSVVDEYVQQ